MASSNKPTVLIYAILPNNILKLLELKETDDDIFIGLSHNTAEYPQTQFVLYRQRSRRFAVRIGNRSHPRNFIAFERYDDSFALADKEHDDYDKLYLDFEMMGSDDDQGANIKVVGTEKYWGMHKDSGAVGIYTKGTPDVSFTFHIQRYQTRSVAYIV